MRAFVKLRRFVLDNEALRQELEDLKQQTENRFQIVFETLDRLIAIRVWPVISLAASDIIQGALI